MKKSLPAVSLICVMLLITLNSNGQFHHNLSFRDSNLVVDCGSMPHVFDSVTTYTVEARIKFSEFSWWGTVLCKRTFSDRDVVIQCYDTTGQIGIAVSNSGYGYTFSKITPNVWHHLALVYDGNNMSNGTRVKFYIDGIQQTIFFIGVVPPVTPVVYGSRFCLGAEFNDTTAVDSLSSLIVPFKGTMDEVRIWSTARTESEIINNMNAELTLPQSNLVAYYQFNQGVGCGSNVTDTILVDAVGNHPGLLWNFDLDSSASNFITDLDTSVSYNGSVLSAIASAAGYQWFDCDLQSIINGQTANSFLPSNGGNYSVIVSEDFCVDTSTCYEINFIGINEANSDVSINIYPNPLQGNQLYFSGIKNNLIVTIVNEIGKVVDVFELNTEHTEYDAGKLTSGIYFARIEGSSFSAVKKIQVIK